MTEEEKQDNDLRQVLKAPEGRRLYWRLMAECGAFRENYISETNLAYYQKGRKSVGLDMFHDLLRACPDRFKQMQDEDKSQDTRKEIVEKEKIKRKTNISIDSPSLPNTGDRRVKEVVNG